MNLDDLKRFLHESNAIERIYEVRDEEIEVARNFLLLPAYAITVDKLKELQAIIAPGKPIRDKIGMNVIVGDYYPPPGGPDVVWKLAQLLNSLDYGDDNAWKTHIKFEALHPFMDGNGRVGRLLWAWQMYDEGHNPFTLPFLQRFYYQTLETCETP